MQSTCFQELDANLGGGVIKQRIARKGGGKSGGFRAIVLFRQDDLAVFVHAFPKSNQSNLKKKDLTRILHKKDGKAPVIRYNSVT